MVVNDAGEKRDGALKKAIESVLSLLQASLETAGQGKGSLLRLHEETETLLFKGSPEQAQLVERALETLLPPKEVIANKVQAQLDRLLRDNERCGGTRT